MAKTFSSDRERHRYYNSLSEEQKYDAFCDTLFDSEHVVFLGGAGVSTESGIPDFRSKNGLYKKRVKAFGRYKPEYLPQPAYGNAIELIGAADLVFHDSIGKVLGKI